MYVRISRHLSGPKWLKILESAVLIALIVWVLLTYTCPWVQLFSDLSGADL